MIVRIKASRRVYRRLGVVFGKQYRDFAEDRFTQEELKRLQDDPVLTVTVMDGEVADDAGQSGGGGAGKDAAGTSDDQAPAAAPLRAAKVPAKAGQKSKQKPAPKANSSAKPAEGEGSEGGQE
ncbi:hypothetical protein I5I61_21300 [Pseudomonas nitroreducens]|uniref:Mu-like prophage FluMu N-terminal domain-containing protein n=1 Tax=Pseudomonas nitroreducens TaxID=46680 RepID=A0ABS0KPJ7_PSENT|nr:HI1506-related protein [Pseudomonas nitroreducens]MBG6289999.1 hypothetical protein [Pseudomonas nitroreducens]